MAYQIAHDCLFNSLFSLTEYGTSKLHITHPLWGEFTSCGFFILDNPNYTDVTWALGHLKCPVTACWTVCFGYLNRKENIKVPQYWHFVRVESIAGRWILLAKCQPYDECVHAMGLLPDTQNYGLRMHHGLAIPTSITARVWRTCRDAYRDR